MGVNPKKYSDLFSPWKIKMYVIHTVASCITLAVRSSEEVCLMTESHSLCKWDNSTWSTDENSCMGTCRHRGKQARKNGSKGKNRRFHKPRWKTKITFFFLRNCFRLFGKWPKLRNQTLYSDMNATDILTFIFWPTLL